MIYYEVYWAKEYNDERLLYCPDSYGEGRVISEAKLDLLVNDGSKFTFVIHRDHPEYDNITPFNGVVKVYETVNNGERKVKFQGKITSVGTNKYDSKEVTCKGGLYWFKWSYYARFMNKYPMFVRTDESIINIERKKTYFRTGKFSKTTDTPETMTRSILRTHNWQMRENIESNNGDYEIEQIEDTRYPGVFKIAVDNVGDPIFYARENPYGIDVKNNNDNQSEGTYITRDQSELVSTYDWFKNELIEKTECNIVVDEGTGELYVYGEIVPKDDSQTIDVEENLLDIAKDIDYNNVCTVFLAFGKSTSSSGTFTTETSTDQLALSADTQAMVVTDISDTGDINDVVDQNPVVYVTTYETDLELSENPSDYVLSFDEENPPTEETEYMKILKNGNSLMIATEDEFPGGITFTLDSPFLLWNEGIEKYGRIVGYKQWSSASRTALRAYGPAYFKKLIMSAETLEVKAIDKGLYTEDLTTPIQLGRRYHVLSNFHGVDEWLPCVEINIDLITPTNTKYSFKKTHKPFTKIVKTISDKTNSLENRMSNQKATMMQRNGNEKIFIMNSVY